MAVSSGDYLNTNQYNNKKGLTFSWEITSQSVADNRTYIKWTLKGYGSSGYHITNNGYVNINGKRVWTQSTANVYLYPGTELGYGTVEIDHNTEGKASFNVDVGAGVFTSAISVTGNKGWELPTIPRASGINAFVRATEYLDTSYGVRFTPLSSSFYYKIRLSIPSVIKIKDVFVGGNLPTSEREVNFGFSSTDLALIYSKISGTDTSVIIGAVVETYTDSGYTNKVGESGEPALVMTLPTNVKPTITGVTIKESTSSGVPSNWGIYVQNKSKIDFSINASGIYSSTISSYRISINGTNYFSQSGTTGVLLASGTNTYSVNVTDSRGRSATYNGTFNVAAYTVPKISTFSAVRCTSTGTENDEGAYAKITVAGSISSINSKNTQKYVLQYKKTGTSTYTSQTLTGSNYSISQTISNITADVDSSYEFVFTITDYFSSTSRKVSLETAFTLLNFNATGTGLGIGKVSELENTLDVNLASKFRSSLTVDKSLVVNRTDSGTNVAIAAGIDPVDFNDVVSGGALSKAGLHSVKSSDDNGWYNLINIRHRNGAGDGVNFGMQIRKNLTDTKRPIQARAQNGGSWTAWEDIYRAVTLFDNSSGVTGGIELSESAANFSYLEIFYGINCGTSSLHSGQVRKSTKVFSPNGVHAILDGSHAATSTTVQVMSVLVTISGTSIVRSTEYYGNIGHNEPSYVGPQNFIRIYKVIGYR